MNRFTKDIETSGFAIAPRVIDGDTREVLLAELKRASDEVSDRRAGAGLRDLMNVIPAMRVLAASLALRAFVEPVLGAGARVVRGIFFDKTPEANCKVAWHQDLTIAVATRVEAEGFTAWSVKAGITHVQPPASVLERMLTLRVHLDATDEENGALHVLPGSHDSGRMSVEEISVWREHNSPVLCRVPQGGVMAMRPLLLHASAKSLRPHHRRVLHFEYAADMTSLLTQGIEWYES